LGVKPFWNRRADGTLRRQQVIVAKPSRQQSKRANGRVVVSGRSAEGRRLRELIRAYRSGLPFEDERTSGLIRSTASIAIEIEKLEDAAGRGEIVNHFALARLVNTRERNLRRLEEMKARGAPERLAPAGRHGWSSELRRHLHWICWVKDRTGASSYGRVPREQFPALTAEYEEREARGEFAGDVK
jgi:hypothetical protein